MKTGRHRRAWRRGTRQLHRDNGAILRHADESLLETHASPRYGNAFARDASAFETSPHSFEHDADEFEWYAKALTHDGNAFTPYSV